MGKVAKISKFWLKVFLITLFLVFVFRYFFVEPYTVSSVEMESSLLKGDRVLVNKTAYGIRMPITPLTIPFTFDKLFGKQSYSTAIQLGYKRLFGSDIYRNDILLFNNPSEVEKPLDKRSLLLSRCVGVAGDTIRVNESEFQINGRKYVTSPNLMLDFKYPQGLTDTLRFSMNKLNIKERNMTKDTAWVYLSLNRYEAFLLKEALPDSLNLVKGDTLSYTILLPYREMITELTPQNIPIYHDVILKEQEGRATFVDGKLYINGKVYTHYRFLYNYYWLLSDNVAEALDSRYLGLISEQDIIGKASFVWYSSGDEGTRWNRIFSRVY